MSVYPKPHLPKIFKGKKNWYAFVFFIVIVYYVPLGIICSLYAINRDGGIPEHSTASATFGWLFFIPLMIAVISGISFLIYYSCKCWIKGDDML